AGVTPVASEPGCTLVEARSNPWFTPSLGVGADVLASRSVLSSPRSNATCSASERTSSSSVLIRASAFALEVAAGGCASESDLCCAPNGNVWKASAANARGIAILFMAHLLPRNIETVVVDERERGDCRQVRRGEERGEKRAGN